MGPIGGVDIGGTKIRWAVLRRGRVTVVHEVRTPPDKKQFLRTLRGIFGALQRLGVSRVGIGFPTTVRGLELARRPRNLPFLSDGDVRSAVPKGLIVRMDNDARCFARAELKSGSGRRKERLLAIAFGTGVGRAYARNGKILDVTRLSRSEPWENGYKARVSLPPPMLANFIAVRLIPLLRDFPADSIVIGGGLMRKPKMFSLLKQALRTRDVRAKIRRSHFHENAGAIGAALLVEK